jgi:hypothetical protein
MKKITLLIVATVATFLLIVACSKDDEINNPTTETLPFSFLEIGNSWSYESYNFENGVLID